MDHESFCTLVRLNLRTMRDNFSFLTLSVDMFELIVEGIVDVVELTMSLCNEMNE